VPLLKWPEISVEEPPSQESWPHDISFLIGLLLDSNL
jgi:predicted transcriptional regulator